LYTVCRSFIDHHLSLAICILYTIEAEGDTSIDAPYSHGSR
jgi:hypothetical protein